MSCDSKSNASVKGIINMASSDTTITDEDPGVLLKGEFSLFPRKKSLFSVRLTQRALLYRSKSSPDNSDAVILLSDVIGCHRRQGPPSDNLAYFTVYAYPFRKKIFSGKKTRHRVSVTFGIGEFESFEENRIVSDRWRRVILTLSQGIKITKEGIESCKPVKCGKLKFLVNPHSGSGKAMQIFTKQILPMLEEAEIQHDVILTEYAGHAKELATSLALGDCYGIVIVSGDGLLYEVMNGIMNRPDWVEAVKLPVGILPGGSGNGLCCSINYSAGEPITENITLHSTFILIKHKVLPMDLVCVQTMENKVYSFLSTSIGLIADIDFESEKYRQLGGARFTVGALKRIMSLKTYRIKLSYLPIVEYESNKSNEDKKVLKKIRTFSLKSKSDSLNNIGCDDVVEATEDTLIGDADKLRSYSVPGTEENHDNDKETKPRTKSEAHFSDTNGHESVSEDNLFSSLLKEDVDATQTSNGAGDVTPAPIPSNNAYHSSDSLYSDDSVIRETLSAFKQGNAPAPTPLLPPLDQPVPENWVTLEDDFISVAAVYQSHLSNDCMAAPLGRLSEGFVYLLLLRRAGVSRKELLNIFMSMSDGSHVDNPHVEIIKALAFRIEPQDKEGVIMVDGEIVDFGPLQGQVLPHLARIMAIQ